MSSFVWMKILESTPERYDRGIRLLSRGRIDAVYARIAEIAAAPGRHVLDVGCGTGAVSLACAARGAAVIAIDLDAGMLEVARRKDPATKVDWRQASAAEIEDLVPETSLDAVVSCLAFSEMSDDEQSYTLRTARSRLKPKGLLVIADEVTPEGPRGALHRLGRLPLAAATYLLTQTTTRPVRDLAERVRLAGFDQVREERRWGDSFVIVEGTAP